MKPPSRVLVYTRVRPPKGKEAKEGLVVKVDAAECAILLSDKNERDAHVFKCDGVFASDSTQDQLFEAVGQPVLDAALEGYNGCVLAYGQTGSGKTHTLLNPGESVADSGLVPRIAAALFFKVGQDLRSVVTVRVSFLQIYNEQIDDLLKPAGVNGNLRLRTLPSGAVEVEGATSVRVSSPAALMQLFTAGKRNIVYAETKMNKSSSRSHAVFQLTIEKRARLLGGGDGGGAAAAVGGAAADSDSDADAGSVEASVVVGKLTLVDLAGSERVKRSGADADLSGVRFREAVNINTSLLGLGSVMKALGERAKFVPYKDSKLTQLLTDSLGGNCRTALVVCVSPAACDHSESTGALEFGGRAMKIAVHAKVNTATVRLDAQRVADDLSEALRMRAEGQSGGKLYELEEQLREAEARMAALQAEREDNARALAEAEARAAEPALAAAEREQHDAEKARLLALMREREGALDGATDALAAERLALASELAERTALEARLAHREAELEAERQRRQAVEGTSEAMRASLGALQRREAELADALAAARAKLSAAEADSAFSARAREQTAVEKAEAEAARQREADGRAALELRLAEATAELAQMGAVRKERSATLAALEAQLASTEADAAAKAAALAQLAELHEATRRDSAEAARRQRADAAAAADSLTAEHAAALAALTADKAAVSTQHANLVDAFEAANARRDAEAARLTAEKAALVELRAAAEAQAEAAARDSARALLAERALRLEAEGRAEDAARALGAELAGLRAQSARDAAAAAESSASLRAQLADLRAAHARAVDAVTGEQGERALAEARADELACGLRSAESARRAAEATFDAALAQKEAMLAEMAEAGKARELELREALTASTQASAALAELYVRAAAAERRSHQLERRLRAIDAELTAGEMSRELLGDELRLLEERAAADASSLRVEETRRLGELREMAAERDATRRALEAERAWLMSERDELGLQLEALAGERAVEAARYEAARARADARLAQTVLEHEGTVSSLEGALRRNAEERQRALREMEAESRAFEVSMLRKDTDLAALRGDLTAAKTAALRTKLLAGVSVVKHGRKGAPHRRLLRCSRDLRRLEWTRPGERVRAADARAQAPPSVCAHEILSMHTRGLGGARRGGLGAFFAPLAALPEGLGLSSRPFPAGEGGGEWLSLLTVTRSLDLQFDSANERDEWRAAWQDWLALAKALPPGADEPRGTGQADDDETASAWTASLPPTPAPPNAAAAAAQRALAATAPLARGAAATAPEPATADDDGSWMARAAQRLSLPGTLLRAKSPTAPSAAPAAPTDARPAAVTAAAAAAGAPDKPLPPPPAPPLLSPRSSEQSSDNIEE